MMKIYDSHIHVFNSKIVENVVNRADLVCRLALDTENIDKRLSADALVKEMGSANIHGALMLPTADVNNVSQVNRDCIKTASNVPGLFTAGTLHPEFRDIKGELYYLRGADVRIIKLCSFSQRFGLNDSKARKMFDQIQLFNIETDAPFSVVLDTLYFADHYFGTNPDHTTTPQDLMDLVRCFPDINFIGAHMGGLGAPFEILNRHLKSLPNLYLDTSNAAHTLTEDQFIQLLHRHGPRHVLFGTDWPWFLHGSEFRFIDELLEKAGFSVQEKEAVFGKNLECLLGFRAEPYLCARKSKVVEISEYLRIGERAACSGH